MTRFLLRPVRDSEMETIYRWRNEPRVRQVMPYSREIDLEAHRRWWPLALADPSRRMLILEDRSRPVATVVFTELRAGVSANWGFYTAPHREISKAKALTAWIACEVAAIFYAFEILRLDALDCDALPSNTAVLRSCDKAGFETIGEKSLAAGKPPFIEKRLTRAGYENQPRCSLFARLNEIAILPDTRDEAATTNAPPELPGMPRARFVARAGDRGVEKGRKGVSLTPFPFSPFSHAGGSRASR